MPTGIGGLDAIAAYGRAIGGAGKTSSSGTGAPASAGGAGEFGEMVASLVGQTAQTIGQAEQASIRQVAGKGDLIDVVTAIGAAETALDTMIAVRDRVVSAYGEIMRMQI